MNKATYTKEVPEDRVQLLEVIVRESLKGPLKVMIVGGTDSGKTTLLTFLANELLKDGIRVAVVDSDVGQKSILPPATVSLGIPDGPFSSLSEVKPLAHYFIGTTTPAEYAGETAVGVKRLVDIGMKHADVVLIDTTGFVTGIGAEMKRLKAELVKPDLTVLMGKEGELDGLAARLYPYTSVVSLSVSEQARIHSREERREIRRRKWEEYFKGSGIVEVDLRKLAPTGTAMFQGRPLSDDEVGIFSEVFGWVVFAGWKGEGYVVVKADRGDFRIPKRSSLHAVDFEKLSNLLVGFIGPSGLCLGVGILKWLRFGDMRAEVLTPLDEGILENAVELRFGRIRVLETGEELGLLRREEL
ncbi:MAG: polynucleotide 5-hydroxyl-kinase [Thermococcaceae archaeon]|nr:polynucleotide 5-hydroxyl-kinase [Thermococcaceae archaeon]MDK2913735.1 polynucleotide 5-hydroxyl-kinase [Thermococcaceae archaeon]